MWNSSTLVLKVSLGLIEAALQNTVYRTVNHVS